jgi:hypothetical protein
MMDDTHVKTGFDVEQKQFEVKCYAQQFMPQFWGIAFFQIDDLRFNLPNPIPFIVTRSLENQDGQSIAAAIHADVYLSLKRCPKGVKWIDDLPSNCTKEQFEQVFSIKAKEACLDFATGQLAVLLDNIAGTDRKLQTHKRIMQAISPFIWDDDRHAVTMSIYNRVKRFNGLEPGLIHRAADGLLRLHELAGTRKQALVEAFKPCKT